MGYWPPNPYFRSLEDTVAMKALFETGSCVAHTGLNFLVTKADFELWVLQPPPSKCCNFSPAPSYSVSTVSGSNPGLREESTNILPTKLNSSSPTDLYSHPQPSLS